MADGGTQQAQKRSGIDFEKSRRSGSFYHTMRSAKKLIAGKALDLRLFDGQDEQLEATETYKTSVGGPFQNGRGAILALRLKLVGPGGGMVDFTAPGSGPSPAYLDRYDAWCRLVNHAQFHIRIGETYYQAWGLLGQLTGELPYILKAQKVEDNAAAATDVTAPPTILVLSGSRSLRSTDSEFPYVFKHPCRYQSTEDNLNFKIFTRAYNVPADLDNHIALVEMEVLDHGKRQ